MAQIRGPQSGRKLQGYGSSAAAALIRISG
jgi:hypothetical protein